MYVYIFSAQKVNSKRILLFTCNDDPHVGNTHLQVSVVWLIWINLWVAAFSFLSRDFFYFFYFFKVWPLRILQGNNGYVDMIVKKNSSRTQ